MNLIWLDDNVCKENGKVVTRCVKHTCKTRWVTGKPVSGFSVSRLYPTPTYWNGVPITLAGRKFE